MPMKSCSGWEESEPLENIFEVLVFTISLLFPAVPLLCVNLNTIPSQRIKEPWVQLHIVLCPHWEMKPVICKKPQYQQQNIVHVVVGNCWDKTWLEVITGPGVLPPSSPPSLRSSCEPFFLLSSFSVLPDSRVLPVNNEKQESRVFVLWLSKDRAVIHFADMPRTCQQFQKQVCYKWFFMVNFLNSPKEESKEKWQGASFLFFRNWDLL